MRMWWHFHRIVKPLVHLLVDHHIHHQGWMISFWWWLITFGRTLYVHYKLFVQPWEKTMFWSFMIMMIALMLNYLELRDRRKNIDLWVQTICYTISSATFLKHLLSSDFSWWWWWWWLLGMHQQWLVLTRPKRVPEGIRYSVFEITTRTLLEKFYYSAE